MYVHLIVQMGRLMFLDKSIDHTIVQTQKTLNFDPSLITELAREYRIYAFAHARLFYTHFRTFSNSAYVVYAYLYVNNRARKFIEPILP